MCSDSKSSFGVSGEVPIRFCQNYSTDLDLALGLHLEASHLQLRHSACGILARQVDYACRQRARTRTKDNALHGFQFR